MTDLDLSGLSSVTEALHVIDATPVAPRRVSVALQDAQGLRLAADLKADRDYPAFPKSLMDGFAVRCADVAGAPVTLRVAGRIHAGESASAPLGAAEAMAIMTGAPLPEGADGVVPVEDAEPAGQDSIRILRSSAPGRYIARRGSDCAAGRVVLKKGTLLEAGQLAVAASVGAAMVEVFAPPRVAVLATGDEIVPVDVEPGPWQLRNSNSPMLIALLRRMGCQVTDLGIARDEPEEIRTALSKGFEFDALFVTGGMSRGERDHVPRLLTEMSVSLKLTKLRVKPGKPFVFGTHQPSGAEGLRYVFGLPGNPVSGFVCTVRFASRLLTRLAGGAVVEKWVSGRIDCGLPVNGPREFYQPAFRTMAAGGRSAQAEFARIVPLAWKGSADLCTLAAANVLLVRAENEPPLPIGTFVRVLEI